MPTAAGHALLRTRLLTAVSGAGSPGLAARPNDIMDLRTRMTLTFASAIERREQGRALRFRHMVEAVIAGIVIAAATLAILVVVRSPGIRLRICPYCYGFERVEEKIYVEAGTPPAVAQPLMTSVQISRAKIAEFFTSRESDPAIFFCITEACYRRAEGRDGDTLGISFSGAVVISPQRLDGVVLTHELTHAEYLQRLGPRSKLIPIWFAEGLAVYVSDDRRYLAPANSSDRCLTDPAGELPETQTRWLQVISYDTRPYAQAGCRVSRWLARKGNGTVLELIKQINSGRSFADAYR
jgi:hypothetical protein